MTMKFRKLIYNILACLAIVAFISLFLGYFYFFDKSSIYPNTATGNIYLLNQHGSKGYITHNQQLFLDVALNAFLLLSGITAYLGLRWKFTSLANDKKFDQKFGTPEGQVNTFLSRFEKPYKAKIAPIPKPYIGIRHTALAFAAVLCIFMGIHEIAGRMLTEVEGTIISNKRVDYNPSYLIKGPDGKEIRYELGPSDLYLPRGLMVGTYIKKSMYELSWCKNGELVNDFPLKFYIGLCILGVMLGYWSYSQWWLNRPTGKKETQH